MVSWAQGSQRGDAAALLRVNDSSIKHCFYFFAVFNLRKAYTAQENVLSKFLLL